jgi:hypothetical protein
MTIRFAGNTGERHVVIKSGRETKGDLGIPGQIDGCPVTEIGDFSFFCCAGLTSVSIPASVTYIGHLAFRSCTGLASVAIPDSVKCIEHRAFSGCTGFTSVTIGKGVTRIAGEVFCGCRKLSDVAIHGDVSDLGTQERKSMMTDWNVEEAKDSIKNGGRFGAKRATAFSAAA